MSCTIIVTDANALTRAIHDRMPVLIDKADFEPWLSGAAGAELLRPAAEDRVRMWPASRRVNKNRLR
jgi:putative SOS response-associated peptidase YedK